jgi:hypothetical protein
MIFLKIHIFFHSFNYTAQNVVLISIHILFRKGEKTEKEKEKEEILIGEWYN